MAITTRYFGVTANGAGDGTTWSDRAAFASSGTLSTVISGFNFAGSDALLCAVGPGTHTLSAAIAAGIFSNVPTQPNMLILHGCDSSGNLLTPPDPSWRSNEPEWDDSTLPVIETTTNVATITEADVICRLIKLTASGRNGEIVNGCHLLDWCIVEQSTANTSAIGVFNTHASNSVIKCTGSSYNYVAGLSWANNTLFQGVTGSSGNRNCFIFNNSFNLVGCTFTGAAGDGIQSSASVGTVRNFIDHCTIVNNGGDGIQLPNQAQTLIQTVNGCMITGNGGYGINLVGTNSATFVTNCRLRDNTSGNFLNFTNRPTDWSNYTTDSDDSTEYNNVAGGDFRIKASAAIWGGGYGVSDMPTSAGYRQSSIMNTHGVWSL